MSGTHGDLFSEIGSLVVAAHAGQAIDLPAISEELAGRYENLGIPSQVISRAIARSLGAVGFSLAMAGASAVRTSGGVVVRFARTPIGEDGEEHARSASGLFPSGVRLGVLS